MSGFSNMHSNCLSPVTAGRPQMDFKTSSKILERQLPKHRGSEVNLSVFSLLYSEVIKYYQNRSEGIEDLEAKLAVIGYEVGIRMHLLFVAKEKLMQRRESRLLSILYYLHDTLYRFIFGKAADSLEMSNDSPDEYMIIDLNPVTSSFISLPREMGQLCCSSFIAGIFKAVLVAHEFPARVSGHTQPIVGHPSRTVFLIKFDSSVMQRERRLALPKK